MRHRKCGGVMIKIQVLAYKIVYQCNRCGKILTLYRRLPPVAITKIGVHYGV